MRHCVVLLAVVSALTVGQATTDAPYAGHCRLLRRVASRSPRPDFALALLNRVALGRPTGVPAELEGLLNLRAGLLNEKEFVAPEVRACAFQIIGELGSEEGMHFLSKLSRSDLGLDAPIQLWTAARIALQNTLLLRIADDQDKRLFLENILASPQNDAPGVRTWATNQLCDRGDVLSIGLIQRSLRELWPGQSGEDKIRFCEQRIQAVSRYPERAKAIGSVLKADAEPVDDRLLRWAIQQLAAMRSPSADAELQRFAVEAGRLTGGSKTHRLSAVQEAAVSAVRARSVSRQ